VGVVASVVFLFLILIATWAIVQTSSVPVETDEDWLASRIASSTSSSSSTPSTSSSPLHPSVRFYATPANLILLSFRLHYSNTELGFVTDDLHVGASPMPPQILFDPGSSHLTVRAKKCRYYRCGTRAKLLTAKGDIRPDILKFLPKGVKVQPHTDPQARQRGEICIVSDCPCGDDAQNPNQARASCDTFAYIPGDNSRAAPASFEQRMLRYGSQENRIPTPMVESVRYRDLQGRDGNVDNLVIFPAEEIRGSTASAILGMTYTFRDDPRSRGGGGGSGGKSGLHATWLAAVFAAYPKDTPPCWTMAFRNTSQAVVVLGPCDATKLPGPTAEPSARDKLARPTTTPLREEASSVTRHLLASFPFLYIPSTPDLSSSLGSIGESFYISPVEAVGVRRLTAPASETRWWHASDPDPTRSFPHYCLFDLGTLNTFLVEGVGDIMLNTPMSWSEMEDAFTLRFRGGGEVSWDPRQHMTERGVTSLNMERGRTMRTLRDRFGGLSVILMGARMMCAGSMAWTHDFSTSEMRVYAPSSS